MKLVRYTSILSIVFLLLTTAALADSKQKGEVTFSSHVVVSGTELEPGKYVVRWNGNGPGVQLRFMRDGEEVVSVTGSVIQQKNPQNSFTTSSGENGSRVLAKIDFSDVTLVVTPKNASTAE
jgi:hypothetical protein